VEKGKSMKKEHFLMKWRREEVMGHPDTSKEGQGESHRSYPNFCHKVRAKEVRHGSI